MFHGIFTIGKKENYRYNCFLSNKRNIVTCVIVFVLVLAINSLMRYASQMAPTFIDALLAALPLAVGATALLFALNYLMIYLRIHTLYKKKQMTDFTQDVTLDKKGIHASSERGSVDLPWNNISLVRESAKDFIVFITDTHAYVFPKDQLKNPGDADLIRTIFKKNMEARLLKLRG